MLKKCYKLSMYIYLEEAPPDSIRDLRDIEGIDILAALYPMFRARTGAKVVEVTDVVAREAHP